MERIWQIVKLKRMMRRWRSLICRSPAAAAAADVRRPRAGYAPVYVGSDRRRFEIPARYLNLPVITGLLEMAEEEFGGAQPAGALSLPCEPAFFRWVLDLLDGNDPRFRDLALDTFSRLFTAAAAAAFVGHGDCSAALAAVGRAHSCALLQRASV